MIDRPVADNPMESFISDGGYTGIFRKIACIGDSLASGQFESTNEDGSKGYHDMYEYSWGQYIARTAGCTVYNFSHGAMTASGICKNMPMNVVCGMWNWLLKHIFWRLGSMMFLR